MPGPFSFVAFAVFPLSSRGLLLALISSTAHEHVPLDPSEVLDLLRMSTKLANRHRQIWRRGREVLVFADHNPASAPATPHCFSPDR